MFDDVTSELPVLYFSLNIIMLMTSYITVSTGGHVLIYVPSVHVKFLWRYNFLPMNCTLTNFYQLLIYAYLLYPYDFHRPLIIAEIGGGGGITINYIAYTE